MRNSPGQLIKSCKAPGLQRRLNATAEQQRTLVGHRLFFSGDRFEIQSKDRKSLYSGTFQVDASAKPAVIDFEHAEGGLKGKTWKGIYVLDGETLTICDNAENLDAARPSKFAAKSGSGYVLVTFDRAKP